jgi:hypothetical protein
MIDTFHSPHLTLDRAKHHIRDFNTTVKDFMDSKPWTYLVDKKADPTKDIHKIKFTHQLSEMLPCILFDIANNLRAVLDQAGYAAAIASGKVDPKRTNFPFADDLPGLENNIRGRKVCADLPSEIVALFEGFRPYKAGNDILWALNKVCNTKKHCALVPLQIDRALATFSAAIPDEAWAGNTIDETGTVRGWDAEKREMTLVTVPSGMDPRISGNFFFSMAIDGIDTLSGQHAVHVIEEMCSLVERVLLATEAECRSLGLVK